MKLDERLALINAGYTKEEIAAFEAETAPAPAPAAPEQTPEPDPEPKQAAPQPVQTAPAAQDQILEALNRLTNTIIQHNTNNTVIQPAERTPEDALAEVIAPPNRKKTK